MSQQFNLCNIQVDCDKIEVDFFDLLVNANTKNRSIHCPQLLYQIWKIWRRQEVAINYFNNDGARLMAELSKQMTTDFGKGFTVANLKNMRQFYIEETIKSNWSTRQLKRQINSFFMKGCYPAKIKKMFPEKSRNWNSQKCQRILSAIHMYWSFWD